MAYSIENIKAELEQFGKYKYIKAELLKRGYTVADLARELGVSTTTIFLILQDKTKSKRVAKRIEEIIGVPQGTLFEYTREG